MRARRARLALAVLLSLGTHLAIALLLLKSVSWVRGTSPSTRPTAMERMPVTLWNAPGASTPSAVLPQPPSQPTAPRAIARPAVALSVVVGEAQRPPAADEALAVGANVATAETSTTVAAAGTVHAAVLDLTPLNQKLRAAARSCYPPMAARYRLQGTAKVGFCVGGEGEVSQVRLIDSSGSALLDSAAGSCVFERASPLPRETSGRCFELPVEFEAGS